MRTMTYLEMKIEIGTKARKLMSRSMCSEKSCTSRPSLVQQHERAQGVYRALPCFEKGGH